MSLEMLFGGNTNWGRVRAKRLPSYKVREYCLLKYNRAVATKCKPFFSVGKTIGTSAFGEVHI